jgi:exonuclease VII large subunit
MFTAPSTTGHLNPDASAKTPTEAAPVYSPVTTSPDVPHDADPNLIADSLILVQNCREALDLAKRLLDRSRSTLESAEAQLRRCEDRLGRGH